MWPGWSTGLHVGEKREREREGKDRREGEVSKSHINTPVFYFADHTHTNTLTPTHSPTNPHVILPYKR